MNDAADLVWGKDILAKSKAALEDPALLYLIETAITQPDAIEKYLMAESDNAMQIYLDVIGKVSLEVRGESGSGKSTLVDCVLRAVPPSWWTKLTGLTDKSLRYLQDELRILYIAERRGLHTGQESTAEYDAKVTISEDGLSTLIPEKGEDGKMHSVEKKVRIQQFIFTSTEAAAPPELENRIDSIQVRDDKAQNELVRDTQLSKAALKPWRHTTYAEEVKIAQCVTYLVDRDAPEPVIIPYAKSLSTILRVETPSVRRYGPKLLRMIKAVTRIHYRQRPHIVGPHGEVALVPMPVDLFIVLGLCERNLAQSLGAISDKAKAIGVICEQFREAGSIITTRTVLDALPTGTMAYRTVAGEFKALRDLGLLVPKMDEEGAAIKKHNRASVYDFKGSTEDFLTIDCEGILGEAAPLMAAWWMENGRDLPPLETTINDRKGLGADPYDGLFSFSPVHAAAMPSEAKEGAIGCDAGSEGAPPSNAPHLSPDREAAERSPEARA
jgi:hypothetical protein